MLISLSPWVCLLSRPHITLIEGSEKVFLDGEGDRCKNYFYKLINKNNYQCNYIVKKCKFIENTK